MATEAIVVAVIFGGLMGWGLGSFLEDIRPVVAGLLLGLACGAVVLALDLTADPGFTGLSLVLGCAGALVALAPRLRPRR
jgi:hypothetical protein